MSFSTGTFVLAGASTEGSSEKKRTAKRSTTTSFGGLGQSSIYSEWRNEKKNRMVNSRTPSFSTNQKSDDYEEECERHRRNLHLNNSMPTSSLSGAVSADTVMAAAREKNKKEEEEEEDKHFLLSGTPSCSFSSSSSSSCLPPSLRSSSSPPPSASTTVNNLVAPPVLHQDRRVSHFLSGVASGEPILSLLQSLREEQQQQQQGKQHTAPPASPPVSRISSLVGAVASPGLALEGQKDGYRTSLVSSDACGLLGSSQSKSRRAATPVSPPSSFRTDQETPTSATTGNTPADEGMNRGGAEMRDHRRVHSDTDDTAPKVSQNTSSVGCSDGARKDDALPAIHDASSIVAVQAALLLSVEDSRANEEATRLFVESSEVRAILRQHWKGSSSQKGDKKRTLLHGYKASSIIHNDNNNNKRNNNNNNNNDNNGNILTSGSSSSALVGDDFLPHSTHTRNSCFLLPCLSSLLSPVVVAQMVRAKLRRGECEWEEALGWLRETAMTPVVAATCIDVCKKVGHWSVALECLAAIPPHAWTEMDVSGTIQSLCEASRCWELEEERSRGKKSAPRTAAEPRTTLLSQKQECWERPSPPAMKETIDRTGRTSNGGERGGEGLQKMGERNGERSPVPGEGLHDALEDEIYRSDKEHPQTQGSDDYQGDTSGEISGGDPHYHSRFVFTCHMATKILCLASQHVKSWGSAAALNNTLGLFTRVGESQWFLVSALLNATLGLSEVSTRRPPSHIGSENGTAASRHPHLTRTCRSHTFYHEASNAEIREGGGGGAAAAAAGGGGGHNEQRSIELSVSPSATSTTLSHANDALYQHSHHNTHEDSYHPHQPIADPSIPFSFSSTPMEEVNEMVRQVRHACRPLRGVQPNALTLYYISHIFQSQWALGLSYAHSLMAAPYHVPIGGDAATIEKLLQLCIHGQQQRDALYFMEQRNQYLSSRSADTQRANRTGKKPRPIATYTSIRSTLHEPLARLLCQRQPEGYSDTASTHPCGSCSTTTRRTTFSDSPSATAIYMGVHNDDSPPQRHSCTAVNPSSLLSATALSRHFNANTLSRAYNTLIQQSKTVEEATPYCDVLKQHLIRGGGVENESLAHLVHLYAREGDWVRALSALRELAIDDPRRHARFIPTAALHDAVQYALEQAPPPGASWEVSVKLFTDMTSRRNVPLSDVAFQSVIKKCFAQGASSQAQKLFEYLIRHGVK